MSTSWGYTQGRKQKQHQQQQQSTYQDRRTQRRPRQINHPCLYPSLVFFFYLLSLQLSLTLTSSLDVCVHMGSTTLCLSLSCRFLRPVTHEHSRTPFICHFFSSRSRVFCCVCLSVATSPFERAWVYVCVFQHIFPTLLAVCVSDSLCFPLSSSYWCSGKAL